MSEMWGLCGNRYRIYTTEGGGRMSSEIGLWPIIVFFTVLGAVMGIIGYMLFKFIFTFGENDEHTSRRDDNS